MIECIRQLSHDLGENTQPKDCVWLVRFEIHLRLMNATQPPGKIVERTKQCRISRESRRYVSQMHNRYDIEWITRAWPLWHASNFGPISRGESWIVRPPEDVGTRKRAALRSSSREGEKLCPTKPKSDTKPWRSSFADWHGLFEDSRRICRLWISYSVVLVVINPSNHGNSMNPQIPMWEKVWKLKK